VYECWFARPKKTDTGRCPNHHQPCDQSRTHPAIIQTTPHLHTGTEFEYAGCVSLPRCLHLTAEGALHQSPLPEINKLRSRCVLPSFVRACACVWDVGCYRCYCWVCCCDGLQQNTAATV